MFIWIALGLILAVIVAFGAGVLRFQKKQGEPESTHEPFFKLSGQNSQKEEPEEKEELVDLVDYYADYEDKEKEAKEPEKPKFQETEEFYDRLCNVKVGRGYLADCQNFLQSMAETGQGFALVYFDYNRFRFVNTLRGFSTGDYALTKLAQETKPLLPEGALFSRLSADHFVVLMVYIDDSQLTELCEGLKRAAERIRGDVGAKSGLQISMGVALTESAGDYDIFKLIRRANIARHCHKLTKAESYSVYDESMPTSSFYGESSLEDYSEHQYADDFTLYLRPQLLLTSKRITSCDAAARWTYEDSSDSLPLMDGGMISGSNLKVAYQAMRTLSRWRKAGSVPLPIMVALGELDFFKDDIDAFFVRCLAEFQLEPHMVTVVASLHLFRIAPELAKTQCAKLTDVGLKLAVNDIDRGIQEESLEVLKGIKLDYLKLHRSFLRNIVTDPEREADVKRIIEWCKPKGIAPLFEGTDSAAAVALLSQLGATMVQGRYVGDLSDVDTFTGEMADFLKGNISGGTDLSGTVVLDDATLQKGDFNLF